MILTIICYNFNGDFMKRHETKSVKVGNLILGGNDKVYIQSMTTTKTKDINKTVAQILELEEVGCEIIRVSVLDKEDAYALKEIKKQIHIPLVADIHFDYELALLSIEANVDKIRINPGNITDQSKVKLICEKAKEKNIPIRIGVNSGSMPKDLPLTAEGMVEAYISEDGKVGAVVEVNSETDFVAKNEEFRTFVMDVAKQVVVNNPATVEELLAQPSLTVEGKTVNEVLIDKIATIGENMTIRRFARFETTDGLVEKYIHGDGKIAVLVNMTNASKELAKDVCMQIAAAKPEFINREAVPAERVEKEREILKQQTIQIKALYKIMIHNSQLFVVQLRVMKL